MDSKYIKYRYTKNTKISNLYRRGQKIKRKIKRNKRKRNKNTNKPKGIAKNTAKTRNVK